MKFYQALPMLFIAMSSCGDDSRSTDPGTLGQIAFGVTETPAESRSAGPVCAPDEMTLMPDAGCGDIAPVTTYITVADMSASQRAGRGTPITGTGNLGDFSIYSFYYRSADASPATFFANESTEKEGGIWTTVTKYYWPTVQGSTLTFRAMTGIDAEGVTVAPSALTSGELEIDYKVPPQAAAQSDLMLAATGRLNTPGQPVPLEFRHLCAAVRFVTGNEMQPGTIKSIILSGIKDEGQYTTTWNNLRGNAGFTIDVNKATTAGTAANEAIAPDNYTLMMIPQQLGDDAMLTVVFEDDLTGRERTMSASLKGQTWRQGKTTVYHIGITPDYELEFISQPEVQDAYYVICNSAVRVSGIPADKAWTLTVAASDSSDPSVQLTADINEYVKNGFWTDKKMTNGTTITNESARGTNTVRGKGSGEFPLTVFLPENTGTANRTVTLTLSVDGAPAKTAVTQEITQLPPAWNGNTGWEQIDDDNSGVYGFDYNATRVYVYRNSGLQSTQRIMLSRVADLAEQYNVADYISTGIYGTTARYRNYVVFDYSKMNSLTGKAQSQVDGETNTRELFGVGGTSLSGNFERALLGLRRFASTETAYRPWEEIDPAEVPKPIEGTAINESQILAEALKKNRYYLNTSTVGDLSTTTALIRAEDIEWYIPAYGQFAGAPAWYGGATMTSADFWSSTAGAVGLAYIGSGATAPRTAIKRLRVARNR